MSAAAFKDRLRADLKAAMQARATGEVSVLRTLIAALDNAEAVPSASDKHVPRAFGEPGGEVARLDLDDATIATVLANEADTRLAAAENYDRHGQDAEAQRLREEAALIARYRAS